MGLGHDLGLTPGPAAARPARPGPRGEQPLGAHEDQVEGHGQHHRANRADEDLGGEVAIEALVDERAEPARADQRGDGDQAHGGHGGDAQAGHDRGDGERQIDPPEAPPPLVAHALGGLPHRGRHPVEPGDDVPEQDQQRVADQRHLGRAEAQAVDRHQHAEQGQAGDGVEDAREPGQRRVGPAPAHGDQRHDHGQHEPDGDGHDGQRHVLPEGVDDLVGVVGHPVPADERLLRRQHDHAVTPSARSSIVSTPR
jgi:hypothetical protein